MFNPLLPVTFRREDKIFIVLLGIVALACAWLYRHYAQDDAFITYRYARNIISGRGFVYNPGEPVLGTTTPLYTLTLALLGKLSGQDIQLVSHLLSVFSLWVSGLVLYLLGKAHNPLLAGMTSLVLISNPLLVSAVGMETAFFIALLLLALKCYLLNRLHLAGLLLGLLMMTRYEGIFWAGLLGCHYLIRRRQIPFWLVVTAAIWAGWLLFAWYNFGQIIPQSTSTKLGTATPYAFAPGAFIWWQIYSQQSPWYNLFLPLALLGGYATIQPNRRAPEAYLLILAWTATYFLLASLVAGSFPWYYGPLIPGLSILLVWGIKFLIELLNLLVTRLKFSQNPAKWLPTGTFVTLGTALVILQLSSWTAGWIVYRGQIIDRRYVHYRPIAEWLNQHAGPDKSLATGEIGVLGYYTDRKIIDLLGLVTPDLAPWQAEGRAKIIDRTIKLFSPDYIVTDEDIVIATLQHYPDYKLARQFEDYYLYQHQ